MTKPLSVFGRWGRLVSGTGTVFSTLALLYDIDHMNQGHLSVSRFGYRLTGYGMSIGVGFVAGGPWGALTGAGFAGGEMVYDTTQEVKRGVFGYGFNQFYRTLIGGWLRR